MNGFGEIVELIEKSIVENPPLSITDGGIIKNGYNKERDELFKISQGGKEWLLKLQEQERKRSGIQTLKIQFNKIFGYYIEVTKTNLDKVPDDYIRKQTLVNAERFITPQLKEQEDRILNAEEKIKVLEYEIFQKIRQQIATKTVKIQQNARMIAFLDCLCGFATVANSNNYVKPMVNDKNALRIKNAIQANCESA